MGASVIIAPLLNNYLQSYEVEVWPFLNHDGATSTCPIAPKDQILKQAFTYSSFTCDIKILEKSLLSADINTTLSALWSVSPDLLTCISGSKDLLAQGSLLGVGSCCMGEGSIFVLCNFLGGWLELCGLTFQPVRQMGPFLFSMPYQTVMVLCVFTGPSGSESFSSGLDPCFSGSLIGAYSVHSCFGSYPVVRMGALGLGRTQYSTTPIIFITINKGMDGGIINKRDILTEI